MMEKYFADEIIHTVNKVRALREDGCFCFQVIADSHVFPLFDKHVTRQLHTFENIAAVNAQVNIDAIFHLGDLLFTDDTTEVRSYWTANNVEACFDVFKTNLYAANANTFFVAGNHDGEYGREPDRRNWHHRMVTCQSRKINGLVKDEPYYYVDFPAAKVRAVCMMSNYPGADDVYYGIYPDQVAWLAGDALLAPDGWGILIFTHICPFALYETYGQDNLEEFAQVITAFQRKTTYRSNVFSVDFRNAPNSTVVAVFTGHGHVDWIALPGKNPVPVIETASNHVHMPTRDTWKMPSDCSVPQREYGTLTEDLWDTVIYNPRKGTIDLIRFGAGEDRHIDL